MQGRAIKITNLGSLLLRKWKALLIAAAIYELSFFSLPIEARTPEFPDVAVIRATSPLGYPYLSGGISFSARQAMERMAGPYNLKVIFTRRAGTPTTANFVVIGHNHSRRVEKIFPHGPWFYIQLPSGAYTILARFNDRIVVIRDVFLGDEGRRTYWVRGD